jgi:hypothetical protein
VIDLEQQDRWLRARARRLLDPADPQFGRSGLNGKLDGPGICVLVLPADDLAQPVDFTDELLEMMPAGFTGLTANGVGSLSSVTSTSTALVRFAPGPAAESWRGFVSVERNGGVQCGVGAVSRYLMRLGVSDATGPQVLLLYVVAHLVRVSVQLQTGVIQWATEQSPKISVAGPFEVTVAIPDATEMTLGGPNEGWQQPEQSLLPLTYAEESNILVRTQLASWPIVENENRDLVLRVLDRVSQAFGDRDRRYLSRAVGAYGTMERSYA